VGRHGVIAGTSSALAVRSALEALKQGGSAADAAVVYAMTGIVLTAGCCTSFAGDCALTYYEASSGRVYYLDASMATLKRENDPLSIPPQGTPSGRSVLVPGFMAGVGATHERFGVLPWKSLFEPAICFAEEGFPIDWWLAGVMACRRDVLTRLPATRRVFTSPDGDLYTTGEIFKQPDLARTLRRFAQHGARDMYSGVWASHFLQAVRSEGSKMVQADLRGYRPAWGDVMEYRYRDHVLYMPGTPSSGGEFIRWILRRLAHD
jgi:gamma-glutamyltranspeptidase/glutathione hydrolase